MVILSSCFNQYFRVFSHLVRLSPANALGVVQLIYVNKQVISDPHKRTQKRTVLRPPGLSSVRLWFAFLMICESNEVPVRFVWTNITVMLEAELSRAAFPKIIVSLSTL